MTDVSTVSANEASQGDGGQAEIFTYESHQTIYGMALSERPRDYFRVAVGTFKESYSNKISILDVRPESNSFTEVAKLDHPYPPTKLGFAPRSFSGEKDMLASTGDFLRLWNVNDDGTASLSNVLNSNKADEFCAPLTSFDWCAADPRLIATSCIDTTVTVWDVQSTTPTTQLIAHDKEVLDVAFAGSANVFGTVGNDGSVRTFDLRDLEHSTIIYESPHLTPILRLSWNPLDTNYLAVVCMDDPTTYLLDIRVPSAPVSRLRGHKACVNAIDWAPHSSVHICSVADDNLALIWDVTHLQPHVDEPILAYNARVETNQIKWCRSNPDWVAITAGSKLQILRV